MVKIIRLVSGEEIIARVEEKDGGCFCTDVSLLITTREGIGFVDWMPYSTIPKDGVFIKAEFVVLMVDPVDKFLEKYEEANSSIVKAKPALITH